MMIKKLIHPIFFVGLSLSLSAESFLNGTIGHLKGGQSSLIQAVLLDGEGTAATVAVRSADARKIRLDVHGELVETKIVTQDMVSYLTLVQSPKLKKVDAQPLAKFGSSLTLKAGDTVYLERSGGVKATIAGRQKTYNGYLPLALLRIHYEGAAPVPGTPIYNDSGELVAIAHDQLSAMNATAGYALPVETLERVRKGYKTSGIVVRSWVGLLLEPENSIPVVSSIRPESPAAVAGVRKGDILVKIGTRAIEDYADAVDAFYYLIADQAVEFQVLRGSVLKSLSLTPVVSPVVKNQLKKK